MYRTPALNNYLTLLKSVKMNPTVSLGKVSEIIEKGEKSQPLFMKEGSHSLTLIGKSTWGPKKSDCIITSNGTIGAFALIDQLRKDDNLDHFLEDEVFRFEVGQKLVITISEKQVVETRIPTDEVDEDDEDDDDDEDDLPIPVKKKKKTSK